MRHFHVTDEIAVLSEPDGDNDESGFASPQRQHRLIRDVVIICWTLSIFCKLVWDLSASRGGHGRHRNARKLTINKSVQYAALTCIGFVCVAYTFSLIELLTLDTVRYFFYISIGIALMAAYLLFLCQLFISFKASLYRLPRWVFNLHLAVILVCEALFGVWAALDFRGIYPWHVVAVGLAGFLHVAGIIHVVYCFNRNLFLLILSQRRTITHPLLEEPLAGHRMDSLDVVESILSTDSFLSGRQLSLLQMIVKNTVLSSFVIGCYVLWFVLLTIFVMVDPYAVSLPIYIARLWCSVLIVLIGTTCIYFSLAITNRYYFVVCDPCHKAMQRACHRLATSWVYERDKEYVMSMTETTLQTL